LPRRPDPTGPVAREAAEHYIWGGNCDGWHLVKSRGLSVIEERMPPGAAEVRHYHESARQFFFVLAGVLIIEVEGRVHELLPRQGLEVAPGSDHQVRTAPGSGAEFLVISQPPAQGDRYEAR
jgi:mannose-6-phosphate isomerase-like protein (cupin superfamily)